jgi:hypothetical protein
MTPSLPRWYPSGQTVVSAGDALHGGSAPARSPPCFPSLASSARPASMRLRR